MSGQAGLSLLQDLRQHKQFGIDWLLKTGHFGQWGCRYAALEHADQHAGLAARQGRYSACAQASCQQPVVSRRRATALHMPQRAKRPHAWCGRRARVMAPFLMSK